MTQIRTLDLAEQRNASSLFWQRLIGLAILASLMLMVLNTQTPVACGI